MYNIEIQILKKCGSIFTVTLQYNIQSIITLLIFSLPLKILKDKDKIKKKIISNHVFLMVYRLIAINKLKRKQVF